MPSEVMNFFYPILLSIVGFFLLQFYLMVKKIYDNITEIKIEIAQRGVRIDNIEVRIEKLERELDELKKIYLQKHH